MPIIPTFTYPQSIIWRMEDETDFFSPGALRLLGAFEGPSMFMGPNVTFDELLHEEPVPRPRPMAPSAFSPVPLQMNPKACPDPPQQSTWPKRSPQIDEPKRTKYHERRRKEAKLVRKLGVCFKCHLLKTTGSWAVLNLAFRLLESCVVLRSVSLHLLYQEAQFAGQ